MTGPLLAWIQKLAVQHFTLEVCNINTCFSIIARNATKNVSCIRQQWEYFYARIITPGFGGGLWRMVPYENATPVARECQIPALIIRSLRNLKSVCANWTKVLIFEQMVFFEPFFYYRPQRSWGKVMFLHLSVILFKGGVCHPLGRHPPEQTPITRQTLPHWTDPPPWADTPPGQTPHPCAVIAGIRSTSWRYASYWNAILFAFIFRVILMFRGVMIRISEAWCCSYRPRISKIWSVSLIYFCQNTEKFDVHTHTRLRTVICGPLSWGTWQKVLGYESLLKDEPHIKFVQKSSKIFWLKQELVNKAAH